MTGDERPDLRGIRVRNLDWQIDWRQEDGYRARWKKGNYGLLTAATQEELEGRIRRACIGRIGPEAPGDEMSPLKVKYPRFWIQRIEAGYLALPCGTYPHLAATLEELDARLRLSK